MSNLQIIECFSKIIEKQIILIKELAFRLSELDAISDYEERIAKAHQDYINVLGADEM